MARKGRFDKEQIERLPDILLLAEELTAEYFKLSSFDQEQFAYDVTTARDEGRQGATGGALAVLSRYSRSEHGKEPRSFFRIALQDENVLAALEREKDLEFDDLMLLVFTHELVHIVRFVRFYKSFYASERERFEEEETVRRITAEILKRLKRPSLERVLDLWGEAMETDVLK